MANAIFEQDSVQTSGVNLDADASNSTKLANALIKGTPILTSVAIACGCVYVGLNNPGSDTILPKCGFYAVTGFYCPGCGMTRAVHSMLHADFLRAFRFNAILVLLTPVFIYFYVWWMNWAFTGKQMPTFKLSRRVIWSLVALAVVFTVGRNFPGSIPNFFALDRV